MMTIYTNSTEHARCKFCQESIAWALTFPNRAKVPLDRPIKTKNLQTDSESYQIAELVSTTHFATCPNYDPATGKQKEKPKAIEQASFNW